MLAGQSRLSIEGAEARIEVPMAQATCPNCHVGLPTELVEYDEVLFSSFSSQAVARGRYARSFRSMSRWGNSTLCARCARNYRRMVRLRTLGRRLTNAGFLVMLGGVVLFVVLSSSSASAPDIPATLLRLTLAALGFMVLVSGAGLFIASMVMRKPATRFLAPIT